MHASLHLCCFSYNNVRFSCVKTQIIYHNIYVLKCVMNYSKTFVKRPLKIDKTKILMTNSSKLMCSQFCNTFDLHKVIIGLESLFSTFLRVAIYTGFTTYSVRINRPFMIILACFCSLFLISPTLDAIDM